MNKVLITGAAGFVGRHTCKLLHDNGYEIYALVRSNPDWANTLGYKAIVADLKNPEQYHEIIRIIDIVIHCAGNPKFGDGPTYDNDNLETTRSLINVMKKSGKQARILYISSIGASDRPKGDNCRNKISEFSLASPTTDYGRSKLESENLIKLSGLPYTILRPALVVGIDMRLDSHFAVFSRWVINKKIISRILWPGKFSIIDVDDFANAIKLSLESYKSLGKTYMCSSDEISLGNFFKMVSPNRKMLRFDLLIQPLTIFLQWLPFKIKSLLMPCLVSDNSLLKELGWLPSKDAQSALKPVIYREYARSNLEHEHPLGLTIVTGAASGLGKAFINWLYDKRRIIVAIDKDLNSLKKLQNQYPKLKTLVIDLEDKNLFEEKTTEILREMNGEYFYSEIFACAGTGSRGFFSKDNIDNQLAMINVNLTARVQQVHILEKNMKRMQYGKIILISSSSAFQPLPYMSVYAATNAALLSFGEGVSYELKKDGIQMINVCPGGMKTAFQKTAGVKEIENENLMEPNEVVTNVIKKSRKNNTTMYISLRSFMMSVAVRFLPRKLSLALWGKLMSSLR